MINTSNDTISITMTARQIDGVVGLLLDRVEEMRDVGEDATELMALADALDGLINTDFNEA